MAIFTQLSVIATPGGRHIFVAKSPEAGEKGLGPFTQLSVIATPGGRHIFVAKSPEAGEKGLGPFTQLSVIATPGGRHIFLPKSIAVPPPIIEEPEVIFDAGGGIDGRVQEDLYRWRLRDDREIVDIIMTIVLSGRL